MFTKIFVILGIKKVNREIIDSWIAENRTDLIVALLRNKKSSQRVIVLRSLQHKKIIDDVLEELIKIIVNSDMHLESLAIELIKEYSHPNALIHQRLLVAKEVYNIRLDRKINFSNYLSQSGNKEHVLINKNKMQGLKSLKKQLRTRIA